jgi:hypothetical protein
MRPLYHTDAEAYEPPPPVRTHRLLPSSRPLLARSAIYIGISAGIRAPPPVRDTCSPVRVPCSHICVLILLCMCPHLLCMCPGNAVYVSSYCCVCVLVSSYCCMCVLILQYVSAQTAIYVCPHTDVYVSMCRRPAVYMCPDTAMYVCPHTVIHMSSYCYIYALILLYMCPHTAINVSSYCALVTLARARQFAPVREPVLAS